MSRPDPLSPIGEARYFSFAGVELDQTNHLLRIDGRQRTCPDQVFKFLLLLCKSPKRVIFRGEMTELLWPGGQIVSDEALTQVLFRARALLGPYGDSIHTVRGRGLRLDATVTALENSPAMTGDIDSLPSFAEQPSAQVAATGQGQASRRKLMVWLFAALLLVALGTWSMRLSPPILPKEINAGFGLTLDDLHAERPDTADLIKEAFRDEAIGERPRGIELLQAVHRADTSTPIPALFLALWTSGVGDIAAAEAWMKQAKARTSTFTDAYLNLLVDYIEAEVSGKSEQVISRAGALLNIRPGAWRMHHARAHLMEFTGMREAALREIQQIEVTRFGERKLDSVIADRASMGDVEGAQAMLDRIPPASDPATHAFLNGRIAWSRGDFKAAHDFFMTASEQAYELARIDLYERALTYAGSIEAMQGHDQEALLTLQRARGAIDEKSFINYVDLSSFLAQLHAEAGRTDEMKTELERALQAALSSDSDWEHLIVSMTLFRLWPERVPAKPEEMSPEYQALWLAMEHFRSGQLDSARAELARARANGIEHTRLEDEARWLELRLGEPVSPEKVIDPPYPPLSRVMVRREIRNELETGGREVTMQHP